MLYNYVFQTKAILEEKTNEEMKTKWEWYNRNNLDQKSYNQYMEIVIKELLKTFTISKLNLYEERAPYVAIPSRYKLFNELHLEHYTGDACKKCGRIRVERWSNGMLICEKCKYNQETKKYMAENWLDKLIEKKFEEENND